MNNLKYPESWEQAKFKCGQVPSSGDYLKDMTQYLNEAAKLMAERYEQRIAELEVGLKNMIFMAETYAGGFPIAQNLVNEIQQVKELLK